ncbi:MAG TPA: OmpA family protein [Gemmatimonadales bacterium]|nr:OmpA family protein [Gemmatimonadales bacterium]
MRRSLAAGLALAALVPLVANCAVKRTQSNEGGVVASSSAAMVGKATGATVRNALNSASATGPAATVVARQMDKQAQELGFELPGSIVQRIGNGVVLTLPEALLFAQDSAQLTPASRDNLRRLATNLEKYPNTRVMIVGHTDTQGGTERTLDLSQRRAQAIANFLVDVGVSNARITALGRGDAEPIATNDTDAGRQWNRRVEIAIYADEATRFGSRD